MSFKIRTGIFVFLAGVTVALCAIFPNAATNPESGLVMNLPSETETLIGAEVEVSELELKTLPRDTTYLKMSYKERHLPENIANFRQIGVTLILAGSDPRSLHRPEICLDGQGWEIDHSEVVSLETKGGPLEVMDLHLGRWLRGQDGALLKDEKGQKVRLRAHYVYWWVSRDGSTPHSNTRLIKTAMNNMFRNVNDRWGYPSVMVVVDPRLPLDDGVKEARQRAFAFIEEFAPTFQKSLGAAEIEE